MSMDAGGLAQMTYNTSFNGGSLGIPGSGFASRGKGSHIKRLSVPHPSKIGAIGDSGLHTSVSTPRTSRSHLLAGLRTAPKQHNPPATAPLTQQGHRHPASAERYGAHHQAQHAHHAQHAQHAHHAHRLPQTATGASFPNNSYGAGYQSGGAGQPMYSLPEHVLAPPTIDFPIDENGEPIDENLYAELLQTNLFLAAQQQRLQHQLASVTAAAQQFQNMNLGLPMAHQQILSPGLPGMSYYQQQAQKGMQPVVQPVPGQPGVFSVYNPMTGQQSFVVDHSAQYDEPSLGQYQSPVAETPTFRAEVSPPPEINPSPVRSRQSPSPPRTAPSPPQEVIPLPPPSANAFRRNHKKGPSVAANGIKIDNEYRANGFRSAGLPPTPLTGTFGPGQARAGEHPARQPRGPPSLEELVAKPTSKHEGSKNFATRQRRRAVHNLVRAGLERRNESRGSPVSGSAGSLTPSSDTEFTFSGSDVDDACNRSGSLSSKPSIGSLRAAVNGAIGSERKDKERTFRTCGSVESLHTSATASSDEGSFGSGKFVDEATAMTSLTTAAIVAGRAAAAGNQGTERRKAPMLVLSSAEKRKSPAL
ncbi:hypothetical protein AJ80_02886 [Polytolypa hystricis UAMH7299]|uniref:Uncharacterized protein n=1 Tax=Polytolypa hystricis (strain UAMH7299) TaxID=1447883 RepID=A0A2B7YQH6_POLH7|nr:hypothetical protein AJ80_02886 [Polytolypa hystricis UAMH7299]